MGVCLFLRGNMGEKKTPLGSCSYQNNKYWSFELWLKQIKPGVVGT